MTTIQIIERASSFAEDKDIAAQIRDQEVKPALEKGQKIRLDFRDVEGATQSFVHALISKLIRKSGADILDKIEFSHCNPIVRSVIEIVAEYSQLGEDGAQRADAPGGGPGDAKKALRHARPRRRRSARR